MLFDRIAVSGLRRFISGPSGQVTVREANGELVVEIDEDGGLRWMAEQAIDSQGRKCKSGPLHVRFVGIISVREPRPDETTPPSKYVRRDDVFAGHTWASRPR